MSQIVSLSSMNQEQKVDYSRRVQRFFKDGKNRVRLLFLALSLLLWFLIKLSKPGYISTANFSIDYKDLPSGIVFTKDPPRSIQLRIQGTGYALIKYNWFNFKSLDIDLSNLESNRKGETYWTSRSARDFLEGQINDENARILNVYPDTIFFHISKLATRKIPVKLNYNAGFDTNAFRQYGPALLEYDSVLVQAPSEILARLKFIETVAQNIPEAMDSMELNFKLEKPNFPHLSLSRNDIDIQLAFSALTEGKIQVPIQLINVPDSLNLELFPAQTQVVFRCALRDFKDIRPEEFRIYADYREIAEGPNNRFLSLAGEVPPSQVISMQISPKRVEYLVSK